MTATTPTPVWSGFCNVARHHACRGTYNGHDCPCDCHQQPEPGLRIGSLFSGYGGLEQGVQSVVGGTVAWHSEIDPGACKILAHRYPDVPNLGDITAVDWSAVEPVDVLTGGSPCQDVSAAGKRAGMRAGTRSGLWASMCDAIEIIRPGLVVWENVRGVLSAHADSAVEPCPICVGDERDAHLRALGRVVGDLAELGYVGRWVGLRAADVGAPHGRYRIFVAAWPAPDSGEFRRHGWPGLLGGRRDEALGGEAGRHPGDPTGAPSNTHREGPQGAQPAAGRLLFDRRAAADPEGDGRHEGRAESARFVRGSDDALGGAHAAAHPHRDGLCGKSRAPAGRDAVRADQRSDADGCGRDPDPDTAGLGRRPSGRDDRVRAEGLVSVDWGQYAHAVRRWERVTGAAAPSPTELSAKGTARLSPAFVEWMMGLPAGWVTDVPGLSRNEQLKALGNGVVPQQAAAALRMLLPDVATLAAAA